jgi:hypothetical protein
MKEKLTSISLDFFVKTPSVPLYLRGTDLSMGLSPEGRGKDIKVERNYI